MNHNIEAYLDQVFQDGASQLSAAWKGQKAKITLLNENYGPEETFIGEVIRVYYDKPNDCNVYEVKRDSDGKTFSRLTFFIEVEEIK